jgi:hypothetical protein
VPLWQEEQEWPRYTWLTREQGTHTDLPPHIHT